MSASYKVLAPYVTLKVKDVNGQTQVRGYYAEGVVENPVEDDTFEKHVRTGLIEKISNTESEKADKSGKTEPPKDPTKPAGNASQEAWAKYAVDSGHASEDEVKDLSRDDLRDLYG